MAGLVAEFTNQSSAASGTLLPLLVPVMAVVMPARTLLGTGGSLLAGRSRRSARRILILLRD
jgi:hypothetical protein